MSEESLKKKIEEFLRELPDRFTILEDQIPLEDQLGYFDFSGSIKENIDVEKIVADAENLFDISFSTENKKELLCRLASVERVEAYRYIEKYCRMPDTGLENWAKLALLESRMCLESYLTDENQMFISTGLGGKGEKLRYFIVCFLKDELKFSESQKKIIKIETESIIENYGGERESLEFSDNYFSFSCLLTFNTVVQELIEKVINECNVYGNFLLQDFMVTNVRVLNNDEIISFLTKIKNSGNDEK